MSLRTSIYALAITLIFNFIIRKEEAIETRILNSDGIIDNDQIVSWQTFCIVELIRSFLKVF